MGIEAAGGLKHPPKKRCARIAVTAQHQGGEHSPPNEATATASPSIRSALYPIG